MYECVTPKLPPRQPGTPLGSGSTPWPNPNPSGYIAENFKGGCFVPVVEGQWGKSITNKAPRAGSE